MQPKNRDVFPDFSCHLACAIPSLSYLFTVPYLNCRTRRCIELGSVFGNHMSELSSIAAIRGQSSPTQSLPLKYHNQVASRVDLCSPEISDRRIVWMKITLSLPTVASRFVVGAVPGTCSSPIEGPEGIAVCIRGQNAEKTAGNGRPRLIGCEDPPHFETASKSATI